MNSFRKLRQSTSSNVLLATMKFAQLESPDVQYNRVALSKAYMGHDTEMSLNMIYQTHVYFKYDEEHIIICLAI